MKYHHPFFAATILWVSAAVAPVGLGAEADFNQHIKPILESACLSCHGPEKPKGGLRLDTKANTMKGGENGVVIVPGQPDKSPLYTSTILPPDDDNVMPPKGDKLTKEQSELLSNWIKAGANWPEGATLAQVQRINFAKDIQPILEVDCVSCHKEGHAKGKLRLDNKADAFKGGGQGPAIVPWNPGKSPLYTSTTLPPDDDDLMPPKEKGGPLAKELIELLREWIAQGAVWPDGITLEQRKKEEAPGADELPVVTEIHRQILATLTVTNESGMKPYTNTIPGTTVSYVMLPIPGGEFLMGSPESEQGRTPDEGPQHKVAIAPFWMGRCEVTWNEYELFMYPDLVKRSATALGQKEDPLIDAVSRPTKPYTEMSFGMGKDGFPAISMTQHAANKYCQWLSAKTGQFYRLPTEAEWEYACRAGTTTAYSFGDDVSKFREYAWFKNNNDRSLTISLDEIPDLPSFAARLKQPPSTDALSPYLRDQFSPATRKLLSDYGDGPNLELQRALVEDIDRIIRNGPIYTSERFAGVELPKQISDLLKEKPEGEDLIRLNRELLHEAYPKEIVTSDSEPMAKYQKVGLKRPNPWGLYDMHGNVVEWTLDQYDPDYYKQFADTVASNPWNKATTPYPHVARGGSWDDKPEMLRSSARLASSKAWKVQDPQLPKSIWYHTDAQFLGFRIVRPLKVPSPEELQKYWTSGVEKD